MNKHSPLVRHNLNDSVPVHHSFSECGRLPASHKASQDPYRPINKNIINSTITLYKNNKKLFLSILLFLIVFILIGIPYKNWWFNGDDFLGIYHGYKTKTWKGLFSFFLDGNICNDMALENGIRTHGHSNFLSTYYRSLYCIYLTIQYWIFGTNAYFYFLTNVFFHAINTVILFNIFSRIINCFPAILTSLAFAFHPQISYRFGAIVNLHYYINVMLMMLTIILFKKYLDTKKTMFYIISCVPFSLSLFTRETSVVLPFILFLGTFLYPKKTKFFKLKNFIKSIKKTIAFGLLSLSYLSLRAYLYPILFSNTKGSNSLFFIQSIKKYLLTKFPQFQVCIYDALGLSWLPWNQRTIRGIIVISLASLFIYLFIKNTKKIYILYFLICTTLMLWPTFIPHLPYSPRYFYEAYPFLLMAYVILFKYYKGPILKFKKIWMYIFSTFVLFLIYFNIESLSIREKKLQTLKNATYKLIENPKIKNRALFFMGYPLDGFGDIPTHIFWVLLDDPSLPIFFESTSKVTQIDSNLVKPQNFRNIVSKYFSKNYLKIKQIQNGFKFTSLNPQKIAFPIDTNSNLGITIIHKTEKIKNEEMVTDFSILIDKKYLDKNPLFIKWNYETKNFDIEELKKEH